MTIFFNSVWEKFSFLQKCFCRKRYCYLFFGIFVLLVSGCRNNADKKLWQVNNLLEESPDSSLILLKQLDFDELNDSQKADYGIYLCAAHRIMNQSLSEDSIILFSLSYFKKHFDVQDMYRSCHFVSRYYIAQRNFPLAISLLNDGLTLAKDKQDSSVISDFYSSMIQYYYEESPQIDSDQLLYCLNENAKYSKDSWNDYMQGIVRALGIVQDNDSSYFYLNRSIEKAISNNQPERACHYLKNYAQILLGNGRGDDAMACLKRIHQLSPAYKHKMIPIIKAYVYIYKGDLNAAKQQLKEISASWYAQDFGYRYIVSQIESILNYTSGAKVNLIAQSHYADSVIYSMKKQELDNIAKSESKARLQERNMKLKITRERISFIFSFIALIFITVFFFYDRKRKSQYIILQKKLEEYKIKILEENSRLCLNEEEQRASEHNLLSIRREKLQFCIEIFKKEPWFKKLLQIEHYSKGESRFLPQAERKQLMDSLFRVFADVMIDFKSIAPNLNSDEQIYCIFASLGFSNHTISICLAVAESALRMRKSRIRSKLSEDYFSLFFLA